VPRRKKADDTARFERRYVPAVVGDLAVLRAINARLVDAALLWLAGQALETRVTLGEGGAEVADTVTVPYASPVTADDGSHTARLIAPGTSTTYADNTGPNGDVLRTTVLTHNYEAASYTPPGQSQPQTFYRLVSTSDDGDIADSSDDRCVRIDYPAPGSPGLLDYPDETATFAGSCAAAPSTGALISDTQLSYDGKPFGQAPSHGDVTRTIRGASWDSAAGHGGSGPETDVDYDGAGRPTRVTDPLGQVSTTGYTPAAGGPLTGTVTTNALGWQTSTSIDPLSGQPTSVTDPNGRVTAVSYDALGRRTALWLTDRPRSSFPSSPSIRWAYDASQDGPQAVATTTLTPSGGTSTSYQIYDGTGRLIQSQQPAEGGGTVLADTVYNTAGAIEYRYNPYWTDAVSPSPTLFQPASAAQVPDRVQYKYDAAGRRVSQTQWQFATAAWTNTDQYRGDRVTLTPAAGDTPTTTVLDARGNTTELVQYLDADPTASGVASQTTTYSYDAAGRMVGMTGPAGHSWTWSYNTVGLLSSSSDPATGASSFGYDAAGQMVSSTVNPGSSPGDAVTLKYGYDVLGRRTSVAQHQAGGDAVLASWSYDGSAKGQLDSATSYTGSTPSSPGTAYIHRVDGYDAAYRPTGTTTVLPASLGALAGSYQERFYYNADGSIANRGEVAAGALPAQTVHYRYTALGRLLAVNVGALSIVARAVYTHLGQLAQYTQGYGVVLNHSYTYGPLGRLSTAMTLRGTTSQGYSLVSNNSYVYDAAGDPTEIANTTVPGYPSTQTGDDVQCFGYDQLRELTQAWTPAGGSCGAGTPASTTSLGGPAPYWDSYSYDAAGNRLSVTSRSLGGSNTDSYDYTATAVGTSTVLPNAVATITHSDGRAADRYSYDATGDTLSAGGVGFSYTPQGHPATVTANGITQTRTYDADGQLLVQSDPVNGTTVYLGDTELHAPPGANSTDQVTATRTWTAFGAPQAETTGDHTYFIDVTPQHTATTAIDAASGAVSATRYFDPFGNLRGQASAWPDTHGYLNAPTDPDTDLTHLGARDYDPATGRFLTVDPLLDPADPQQANGYSYANNNPVSNTDPTGLLSGAQCGPDGIYCGHGTRGAPGSNLGAATANAPVAPTPKNDPGMSLVVAPGNNVDPSTTAPGSSPSSQGSGSDTAPYRPQPMHGTMPGCAPTPSGGCAPNTSMMQMSGGLISRLPQSGDVPFEPGRGPSLRRPGSIPRYSGQPVDKYGDVWKWDPVKGEWDVQHPDGSHTNVGIDGNISHGPNNTGRNPKPVPGGDDGEAGAGTNNFGVNLPSVPSLPALTPAQGAEVGGGGAAILLILLFAFP
jgi:RHS repeat-associated protein